MASKNGALSPTERERYARQVILPGVGAEGQARLRASSALVVGAGGLGSPCALYLAAAGVGRIGLVEFDVVERSNLHRQVLYADADVGRPKLGAAVARLRALNPDVEVEPHAVRLDAPNALGVVERYDVVADGTDRFATRYLVNDACVLAGRPNVFASVHRFGGQIGAFADRLPSGERGPCYRCLFPHPPPPGAAPTCAEGGVLGALPGLLGTLQAAEVVKRLLGLGEPLAGRLLLWDALGARMREVAVERDPACPACGDAPEITSLDPSRYAPAPMPDKPNVPEITVQELHAMEQRGERPFVLDVRQPEEYEAANLGGALIPLGELPERVGEIEGHKGDERVVVHCRTGGRSARATELLRERGFNAVNLKGGLHAWSDEVDPSVPKV